MADRLPRTIDALRAERKDEVLAVVAGEIDRLQRDGFYGVSTLAPEVQDGLIVRLRATTERIHKFPRAA